MKEWDPKGVWDALRKTFQDWSADDEEKPSIDPALLFHLMLTVPIVIAFLTMARRG